MSNKLYTEEQVRIMLGKSRIHSMDDSEMFTDDYLIEEQIAIILPTDEEIEEMVHYNSNFSHIAFGVKWLRYLILQGGNNEQ